MVDKKILELRNARKAKKPDFVRQEAWRRPKLTIKWRQPKGGQSKLRKKYRGKRKQPSLGYCSPSAVKGLNREGLRERVIYTLSELDAFDVKTEIIIIGKIGNRKKVDILKKCLENKFRVGNVKDVQKYIKDVEEKLAKKKKDTKAREDKKEKAIEKALKSKEKDEKKENLDEKLEDAKEETKKGDKSDKIKILEKGE